MSQKIFALQTALLHWIDVCDRPGMQRDQPIEWEKLHLASCGRLGYLLAQLRGEDPVLTACACSIHDFGRILTGRQENHAEEGYLPAEKFLKKSGLFTEEEAEIMALAVRNHSKKSEEGNPVEEIVKDADVLDFHQYGFPLPRQEQQDRLKRLLSKPFFDKV